MEKEKKKRSQFYNDINENDKAEFINGEVILHSPVMKAHSDAGSLLHQLLNTYVLKKRSRLYRVRKDHDLPDT